MDPSPWLHGKIPWHDLEILAANVIYVWQVLRYVFLGGSL